MKIGNLEVYGVIYKITNKVNGKVYIGQTTRGFNKRYYYSGNGMERVFYYHLNNKIKGYYYNPHIINAVEKYGFDNFDICEIYDVAFSQAELNVKEKVIIKAYNSFEDGYNRNEGGDIISRHYGENNYFYNKRFIGEDNPFYGKKHTYETKEKMRANHYDCKGDKNPNYNKKHTEETKNKISERKKGKPSPTKGVKRPHKTGKNHIGSKKCKIVYNNGNELLFDSITQVFEYLKDDLSTTTIKWLLKTEKEFNPKKNKLKYLKGTKILYINGQGKESK